MNRRLLIAALILFLPALALGATYYKSPTGSAANKEAATEGPCTTAANCMSFSVYAGETFADGDVIVHCDTPIGIPGKIWSEGFVDVSQTLSIPAASSYILLVDGSSKFLLVNGTDKLIRP